MVPRGRYWLRRRRQPFSSESQRVDSVRELLAECAWHRCGDSPGSSPHYLGLQRLLWAKTYYSQGSKYTFWEPQRTGCPRTVLRSKQKTAPDSGQGNYCPVTAFKKQELPGSHTVPWVPVRWVTALCMAVSTAVRRKIYQCSNSQIHHVLISSQAPCEGLLVDSLL